MNSDQPINGDEPGQDDTSARVADGVAADIADDQGEAELEPFAQVLRGAAVWAEPPVGLATMVVEQVRAASAAAAASPVVSRSARPVPSDASSRAWRRLLPAVAAAAAIAFGAGFLIADRGDDEAEAIADVALTGSDVVPEASATGDVLDRGAGYAIRLQVAGLPPAPEGSYYEGFLRAADGEMVSVGTFHMRGGAGAVVLWSGVRVADYQTLVVTAEVERSGDDQPGPIMMEGPVQRR